MRGRGEGSIRQRRRADGTVYWEARVSIAGRQVSFYDESKSGAQAKGRQARADAERGRTTPRATLTVEGWVRDWLAHAEATVRPRTYRRYRELCELHIIPAIGLPAGIGGSGLSSSATAASVVRSSAATETAFSSAVRVTLSGSMMPAFSISSR